MTYLLIIAASLLGAHFTFRLAQGTHLGAIRSSTMASLLFVAVTTPSGWLLAPKLQAAFFGASFVGMSDAGRLSERYILLAALIFSALFFAVSQLPISLGGSLGTSAFLACLIAHAINNRMGGVVARS